MKKLLYLFALLLTSVQISAQTTWYQIPTGTTKKLNTIDFPTSTVGYIGGNDSLLLKTIDGGETWTPQSFSGVTFVPGGEHIIKLRFVSAAIGYMAVGPYTGIYKTIDGGLTWNVITPAGVLCYNQGLFFFDENNGFFGGSGCFQGEAIEKLVGGTMTTATINTPTWIAANLIVDIDFLNSNFGLAASYSGYMLRTIDGGTTWDTISTAQPNLVPLSSVAIYNDTIAYAGYNDLGTGFGILRTIDAGLTWTQDFSSATFYYPAYLSMHKSGNQNIYSGALPSSVTGGVIFESTGYELWNYYPVDQPINALSSYGDSVVFGVGDSGYVVVNQPLGNLSITEEHNSIKDIVVYPNPSQGEINLQFSSEQDLEQLNVSVFNLTGELVYKNETSLTRINIENLESGIYLVQITTANKTYSTKFIKE